MSQSSSGHVASRYFIWQCLKCGYSLVAREPPDRCPDCGAPREEFVLIDED
jgi:rubrerythrin